MKRAVVVSEFQHTYKRHGGRLSVAAPILGMSPAALGRALYRARRDGEALSFYDDTSTVRRRRSGA